MSWERTLLGPRGRGLGRSRWPLVGMLATVIAAFSASIGDWLWFGGAVALVAVCAVLTWRSYR